MTILILCAFGFFASMVDAVAGGGGLISLPALLVFLPGVPIAEVMGTNKFASSCGSGAAVARYALSGKIIKSVAIPAGLAAFVFGGLGARVVHLLDPALVRPVILALLIVVAAYSLIKKDLGRVYAPRLKPNQTLWFSLLMGSVLGFYEGFFGPGTGSFLVFALAGIFGFDYVSASANGRLINVAATFSAMLYFFASGLIHFEVAIPMAVSTILGGLVGSKLVLTHGAKFIRVAFLIVVAVVLAKLTWDTLRGA